jgi:hypothetical protein
VTDEELQAMLLQPSAAAPPSALEQPPDPDAALQAELLQPAGAPSEAGPTRDAAGRVYVVDPSGQLGTVDEAELPTLGEGYQLAAPDAVAQQVEAEKYAGFGQGAAAFGEGVAQGATLGGYGAIAPALFGEEYGQERLARAEHRPGLELAGEITGAVGSALASGGAGGTAGVARFLPAAVEANLGAKLAAHLGTKAAAWGAGKAGVLGARVIATGLESAADMAVRQVLDDAANGDVEITAERMVSPVWDGLATGSALELGMAGLGAAGRVSAEGIRKAAGALGEMVGSAGDVAGSLAYKAAVGRTSVASQRLAARHGGGKEIGQTLLKRGLVQAGDTVEDIAERLPAAREAAGEELGVLLNEVADAPVSRGDVWRRIEQDVIAPLDKAGTQDVADAIRGKLAAAGIRDTLAPVSVVRRGAGAESAVDRTITLGELHQLRRAIDSRPDLKWGAAGPNAPDLTTEAMRDVRRTIESAFEEASDAAATAKGVEGFGKQLKQAKREYAHLALAADQAEQGALAREGRNMLGLNDVLAGVAGAASLGPAGFAGSVVSKLARERFEATAASLLYRGAKRADAPGSLMGRFVDDAAKTELAVRNNADSAVRNIFAPERRRALRVAATLTAGREVDKALERAVALQDPESRESQALEVALGQVAKTDQALAASIRGQMKARSDFIAGKVPPAVDPNDPMGLVPARQDARTARKNNRYVIAAMNPQAALERLSAGQGSPEDLETLKALTPRLYQVYTQRVMESVGKQKRKPTIRERMRLGYLLQMPMDRASTPESVAWFQAIQAPAQQQSSNPNLAPATPRAKVNTDLDPRDNKYAARTDEIMSGR